jgi:hypothetical protein
MSGHSSGKKSRSKSRSKNNSKPIHPNNKHSGNNTSNNTRRKKHPTRRGRAFSRLPLTHNSKATFSAVLGALHRQGELLANPELNPNAKNAVHPYQHMTYPEAWKLVQTTPSKQVLDSVQSFPFTDDKTQIIDVREWREKFPAAIALRLSRRTDLREFVTIAEEGKLKDLKILSLHGNKIGDCRDYRLLAEGVRNLAAALPHLKALTVLDLGFNDIGAASVDAITTVLPKLKALTMLSLSNNSITNEGMITLAKVLPQLTSLTVLNLRLNSIGTAGAKALTTVLPELKSLKLLVYENALTNEQRQAFRKATPPGCHVKL